jgi:polyketide biosynthesis acyl carrier protein
MKSSEEILNLLIGNIEEILVGFDNNVIDRNSKLSPLGLDSIGRAELIEMTLENLDLNLPRNDFYSANNLGELADIFLSKLDYD